MLRCETVMREQDSDMDYDHVRGSKAERLRFLVLTIGS